MQDEVSSLHAPHDFVKSRRLSSSHVLYTSADEIGCLARRRMIAWIHQGEQCPLGHASGLVRDAGANLLCEERSCAPLTGFLSRLASRLSLCYTRDRKRENNMTLSPSLTNFDLKRGTLSDSNFNWVLTKASKHGDTIRFGPKGSPSSLEIVVK